GPVGWVIQRALVLLNIKDVRPECLRGGLFGQIAKLGRTWSALLGFRCKQAQRTRRSKKSAVFKDGPRFLRLLVAFGDPAQASLGLGHPSVNGNKYKKY